MEPNELRHLQSRLKNCLQTILDLEPELERLELGHVLLKEYGVLKSFIQKVDNVSLLEEDVARIENATESFLEELKSPLGLVDDDASPRRMIQ